MKKLIIFFIIFILTGELMIRFDKKFKVLEEERTVKIKASIEITPEFEMLQDSSFVFSKDDFRIMVLGDSYIYGGGIDFKDNFSQNLKQLINSDKDNFNRGYVLDVSRPSANNLDHNLSYFQFVDLYDPDVVILGYNLNDIEGNLNKDGSEKNKNGKRKASGNLNRSTIRKIYDVLYTSELIKFVLHGLHNELKANGHIIKGSRADITLSSYWKNKGNWQRSKQLLSEIIEHAESNNIQLIFYQFPEINLIEYPELFKKTNEAIKEFLDDYPSVIYINGTVSFAGESSKTYQLSKYDGHPNEKAHRKISEEVLEIIRNTNRYYKKNDPSGYLK